MTTTAPVNGLNSPSSVEDDSEVIFVIVIALIILFSITFLPHTLLEV